MSQAGRALTLVRARYRASSAKPEPVAPGAVLRYQVPLHSPAHVFAKGHEIGVQARRARYHRCTCQMTLP
jgi:predicted acyl esterase